MANPASHEASNLPKLPPGNSAYGDTLRGKPVHSKSLQSTGSSSGEPPFNPPMPWFGIDIGGSLVKLVYFEPEDILPEDAQCEVEQTKIIQRYLTSNKTYGDTGIRDVHLEMRKVPINHHIGTLHFIRFPSAAMERFVHLAKLKVCFCWYFEARCTVVQYCVTLLL